MLSRLCWTGGCQGGAWTLLQLPGGSDADQKGMSTAWSRVIVWIHRTFVLYSAQPGR